MKPFGYYVIYSTLIAILNWFVAIVIALCRLEQFYMVQIVIGLINYLLIKNISGEIHCRRFIYAGIITILSIYVGIIVLAVYNKVFNDEGIFSILFLLADILLGMIIALLLTSGQVIFKSLRKK